MISFLLGLIGAVIALVGWFGFHSIVLLIIGVGLYIIETVMEWQKLNANAKKLDIVIFAIGCIIAALFTSAAWYVGGMVAIAIYSLITGVISLIAMLKFLS